MEAINETVSCIGFGMMGQALIGGMLKKGIIKPGHVWVSDPFTPYEAIPWCQEYNVHGVRDNVEAIKNSEVIILAVKPFLLDNLLQSLKNANVSLEGKLIISLVSAFSLDRLKSFNMGTNRIVRIMPNTPCLSGEGATAICGLPDVAPSDLELTKKLMSAVGKAWVLPESRMNIWTAAAGAGPAYVFLFLEAIADAAVVGGVPRDIANEMATQLVYGSTKMAMDSKEHFAKLRDNVCSPAGVTIAGVQRLQEGCFPGTIMSAIQAARARYDVVDANPNA